MGSLESGRGIVSLAQIWLSIKRLEVIYQMMPCPRGLVQGDALQPRASITPHAHGTGSGHYMQHSPMVIRASISIGYSLHEPYTSLAQKSA